MMTPEEMSFRLRHIALMMEQMRDLHRSIAVSWHASNVDAPSEFGTMIEMFHDTTADVCNQLRQFAGGEHVDPIALPRFPTL